MAGSDHARGSSPKIGSSPKDTDGAIVSRRCCRRHTTVDRLDPDQRPGEQRLCLGRGLFGFGTAVSCSCCRRRSTQFAGVPLQGIGGGQPSRHLGIGGRQFAIRHFGIIEHGRVRSMDGARAVAHSLGNARIVGHQGADVLTEARALHPRRQPLRGKTRTGPARRTTPPPLRGGRELRRSECDGSLRRRAQDVHVVPTLAHDDVAVVEKVLGVRAPGPRQTVARY